LPADFFEAAFFFAAFLGAAFRAADRFRAGFLRAAGFFARAAFRVFFLAAIDRFLLVRASWLAVYRFSLTAAAARAASWNRAE
jgi:hypothetical protein